MKKKENARPEAATSERAKRESAWTGGNSRNQSTTAADGGQGAVSSLLMEGRSNALHLADLVRLTGWPERDVRKAIQRERQRGSPILSDNKNGYLGSYSSDVDPEVYQVLIDKHFATKYRHCDYNINHFFSGRIRLMRWLEEFY